MFSKWREQSGTDKEKGEKCVWRREKRNVAWLIGGAWCSHISRFERLYAANNRLEGQCRLNSSFERGKCVTRAPIDFVSPSKESSVKFEQTLFFFDICRNCATVTLSLDYSLRFCLWIILFGIEDETIRNFRDLK